MLFTIVLVPVGFVRYFTNTLAITIWKTFRYVTIEPNVFKDSGSTFCSWWCFLYKILLSRSKSSVLPSYMVSAQAYPICASLSNGTILSSLRSHFSWTFWPTANNFGWNFPTGYLEARILGIKRSLNVWWWECSAWQGSSPLYERSIWILTTLQQTFAQLFHIQRFSIHSRLRAYFIDRSTRQCSCGIDDILMRLIATSISGLCLNVSWRPLTIQLHFSYLFLSYTSVT